MILSRHGHCLLFLIKTLKSRPSKVGASYENFTPYSIFTYQIERVHVTKSPWCLITMSMTMQVILFQVPLEIAWTATVSWWAGDYMCRLMVFLRYPVSSSSHIIMTMTWVFFRIFGFYASGFILIVISLDR